MLTNKTLMIAGKRHSTQPADPHRDRVHRIFRGDEELTVSFAAKRHVGRPALRNGNCFELVAVRTEDRHTSATRQVQVAFLIQRHSVAAHLAKQFAVGQRTVFGDIVAIGFLVADVRDPQLAVFRVTDDAVRLNQIIDDLRQLAVFGESINAARVVRRDGVLPVRSFVERIGEIDRSIGVDPAIIGAAEATTVH